MSGTTPAPFSDIIFYVDESGDASLERIDSSYPMLVLAFVAVDTNAYADDVTSSFQRMKFKYFGHDQIVFHEREIRRQSDAFAFLRTSPVLREAFLSDLTDLISEAEFDLIAAAIRKQKHKDKYPSPFPPYDLALQFCMESACKLLLKRRVEQGSKVHVIFESRGAADDERLELQFRRFASGVGLLTNHGASLLTFDWHPIFVPKLRNSTGLQLADLVARPIGQHVLKGQPSRAYSALVPKFQNGGCLKVFP